MFISTHNSFILKNNFYANFLDICSRLEIRKFIVFIEFKHKSVKVN